MSEKTMKPWRIIYRAIFWNEDDWTWEGFVTAPTEEAARDKANKLCLGTFWEVIEVSEADIEELRAEAAQLTPEDFKMERIRKPKKKKPPKEPDD